MSSEKGPWRLMTSPPDCDMDVYVTVEFTGSDGVPCRNVHEGHFEIKTRTPDGWVLHTFGDTGRNSRSVAWRPRVGVRPMQGEFNA